jgi:hypothetical protein
LSLEVFVQEQEVQLQNEFIYERMRGKNLPRHAAVLRSNLGTAGSKFPQGHVARRGNVNQASLFLGRNFLLQSFNLDRFLPTADLFDVRDVGVLLALEDCINLFQSLAFCLDPEDGLEIC